MVNIWNLAAINLKIKTMQISEESIDILLLWMIVFKTAFRMQQADLLMRSQSVVLRRYLREAITCREDNYENTCTHGNFTFLQGRQIL